MKIKRFQAFLRKKKIDLAIISNFFNMDPNFLYFTGMSPEHSFLLIPKKGNSIFLTSKLEYEKAKRFSGFQVRLFDKPVYECLSKIANRYGKNIGLNKSIVPINEFKHIRKYFKKKSYKDISGILLEQRKTKEPDEIKKIQKACAITDRIFKKIITNFRFKTETEIRDFMAKVAQEYGCTMSFDPIVSSGRNASMPHYPGRNVKLKKGFMVMDFGVNYKGYLSDITRTIYIGKPSAQDKKLYELLLSAQRNAIKKVKIGMNVSELMESVQKDLGRYSRNFIHSLGHGIGVQIHELPSISLMSNETFEEGDTFTIEPGIYLAGKLGIRIEDDVMIKNGKVVVMTKSSKKLIVR